MSEVSDVQILGCYVHDNGRLDVDTDAGPGGYLMSRICGLSLPFAWES